MILAGQKRSRILAGHQAASNISLVFDRQIRENSQHPAKDSAGELLVHAEVFE